jgi:TolA-binding protein
MNAAVWISVALVTAAPDRPRVEAPILQYDQFRREVQLEAEEKREAQIQGILRLLELDPDPDEIPDLRFRLAELYFETSRFYFFRSQEVAERATVREENEEASLNATDQQEYDQYLEQNRSWVQKSLEEYRRLRGDYPRYTRMPEVLFALGQAYWNLGQYQVAVDVYAELIRSHPDSPLISEAWIAFGEYYFDQRDVRRALKSYQRAAEDQRSRVYGFALYKQAWCYYNMAEWRAALKKFRATVLYAQLASELSGENKIALGREAQRDWVRTYAHIGDAEAAPVELAELLGGDTCTDGRCKKLLESLADIWRESGSFQESASLFRQLIAMDAGDPKNLHRQAKVVDLVSRSGSKKRVVAESQRLVAMMTDLRAAAAEAELLEMAELEAESTIRRLAQVWNKESRKTRSKRTRGYARTMYESYLSLFPESSSAYEMRFQLADIYFKTERFDEAARAYEATVLADPEGKYLVDAANDNILAVEEHLRDLRVELPKDTTDPVPLHPQKLRLVEACDRYVTMVPAEQAEQLVVVKFKAAKVQYDYNQFDQALRRFDDIVVQHPAEPQAEPAANLVIDVHNLRKDWASLYSSAARYLASEPLLEGRPRLQVDLRKYAQFAKFKLVQSLEEEAKAGRRDLSEVARAYQEFYEEFPSSENADKALFNASVAWDRAGKKARADGLRQRLLEEYPDSALRADVAFYLAKQHEERTEFLPAARAYRSFAGKYPKDERARDALYNAAAFFAGSGRVKTAAELRREYLRRYGRTAGAEREAADIYWAVAEDLEGGKRTGSAAGAYRDFVRNFPRDDRVWDALWREAQLRRRLGQGRTARRIEAEIQRRYRLARRKGEPPAAARRWQAQLELRELDTDFAAYRRTRIAAPNLRNPRPFQRSLKRKGELRNDLVQRYTAVVTEFADPEATVQALHRIAQSWDAFVEDVQSLPCPSGIPEAACQLVQQSLEETAAPARQSALEAYQACAAKAHEVRVFSDSAQRCAEVLEEKGVLPPVVEERIPIRMPRTLQAPVAHGPLLKLPAAEEPGPDSETEFDSDSDTDSEFDRRAAEVGEAQP